MRRVAALVGMVAIAILSFQSLSAQSSISPPEATLLWSGTVPISIEITEPTLGNVVQRDSEVEEILWLTSEGEYIVQIDPTKSNFGSDCSWANDFTAREILRAAATDGIEMLALQGTLPYSTPSTVSQVTVQYPSCVVRTVEFGCPTFSLQTGSEIFSSLYSIEWNGSSASTKLISTNSSGISCAIGSESTIF